MKLLWYIMLSRLRDAIVYVSSTYASSYAIGMNFAVLARQSGKLVHKTHYNLGVGVVEVPAPGCR
jgi:hypothetical protein